MIYIVTVIICGLFAAVGLILFGIGWYGLPLDGHPTCRECKFDLFGRWPDIERCPECGTELVNERCVRIRHRRRRFKPLGWGAGFIGLSIAVGIFVGQGYVWSPLIQRVMPLWVLSREMLSDRWQVPVVAADEITRRLNAGKISQSEVMEMVEYWLDCQSNTSAPFRLPREGTDVVRALHQDGLMTQEQWDRFMQNQYEIDLLLPDFIVAGHPFLAGYAIDYRPGNVSLHSREFSLFRPRLLSLTANGRPWEALSQLRWYETIDEDSEDALIYWYNPWGVSLYGTTYFEYMADLSPGEYEIKASLLLEISADERFTGPIYDHRRTVTKQITVFPEDKNPVTVVDDPALGEQIRAAVTVWEMKVEVWGGYDNRALLTLELEATDLPVDVAFDVLLRDASQEHRVWGFIWSRNHSGGSYAQTSRDIPALERGPIDLILRYREALQSANAAIDRVWDGEIVYEDIEVVREDDQ
ncbi:MAG: hypothetical protein D8M59_14240 [Planctomycetes bacterium]|nr:hypothetical protein [Planctomycetota bacterium]NOG55491.1 hypothetical protein [Planctomycetota bacterium]